MKTITITAILFCLCIISSNAQETLKLSLIKDTDKTVSEKEHYYQLEVTNPNASIANFKIASVNINCLEFKKEQQVSLNQSVLKNSKNNELNEISLDPGSSLKFYIKIERSLNTKLGTWNCTEVKAISDNGDVLSNSVIIKSLIPDPKKFN